MKKTLSIILTLVAVLALAFGMVSTVNGNNTGKEPEAVIAEQEKAAEQVGFAESSMPQEVAAAEGKQNDSVTAKAMSAGDSATEMKQGDITASTTNQVAALSGSMALKYMAQGQEAVYTFSVMPGDAFLTMAGGDETVIPAIRDLFAALGIQVKAQQTDKQLQGGFDILLNGESVTGITMAVNGEAVYCSSNLLGDKIYSFTFEELNKLAETYMQQAGQQNSQMAAVMNMLKGLFSGNPQESGAAMAQMIGSVDLTKLNEAMNKLIANMESLEVTEAPAKMPDAYSHARITLKKEDLKEVMVEAGKVIWNIPAVQQMLSQNNAGSEEKITADMAAAVDKLQGDVVVDLYINTNQAILAQVNTSVVKAEGENAAPVSAEILFVPKATGSSVEGDVVVKNGETTNTVSFNVEKAGNETNGTGDVTIEDKDGKWQPLALTVKAVANKTEISRDSDVDLTVAVKTDRNAQPGTVTIHETMNEQDLGDHAEGYYSAKIGMEGMGDLLTVNCSARTALAEAYIITEDAVRPMTMSQKEQDKWIESLQSNVQVVMFTALSKLPESVLQLLNSTGN